MMVVNDCYVSFSACKYLDFDDNYTAKKNLISLGGKTKIVWVRPVTDESCPKLVQFCKLRGRLNYPEACHCSQNKMCNEYEDFEHKVLTDSIDT